jgi:hypothetical protein
MSTKTDVDDLQAAREVTLEKFRTAAALIAQGLHEYSVLWQRACRASSAAAKNAQNRPAFGGPLQPETSKHHPRNLKQALGRVLRAAGVDATDYAMRQGARQR